MEKDARKSPYMMRMERTK